MSMQVNSGTNLLKQPPILKKSCTSQPDFKSELKAQAKTHTPQENSSKKLKIATLATTILGLSTAMAFILKGKGYSINPLNCFKTPIKKWGIFNATYKGEGEMEKFVVKLAVASVAGGLIGGAIFGEKKDMKAKYREAVIQLIGNVLTPLLCVSVGLKGFKKVEPKLTKFIEKYISKNKVAKGLPTVLASAASLVAGIFLGNKLGNTINEKLFRCKDNRKIKITDMSPHIDDVCLVLSIVAAKSGIGAIVSRFVPVALLITGTSVGNAKDRHRHIAPESAVKNAQPSTNKPL